MSGAHIPPSTLDDEAIESAYLIARAVATTTEEIGPVRRRVSDLTLDRLCWVVAFFVIAVALTADRWWRW